jgi:hypothetical protein
MIDAPQDDPQMLGKIFIEHVKSDHPTERKPREDANQAAARVIREVTK